MKVVVRGNWKVFGLEVWWQSWDFWCTKRPRLERDWMDADGNPLPDDGTWFFCWFGLCVLHEGADNGKA